MIFKPTAFVLDNHYKHDTYDKIKVAVATVCKALDLKANLSLATMWMIPIEESDKDSFIELVKDELHHRSK